MRSATSGVSIFGPALIARLATICALAVLAALGVFYCLNGELNADEGFYLLASRLVAGGFRPYQDFGFTQTPLLPYANLPWLALFGFSLAGIRLAGLAWVAITVIVGCAFLRPTKNWTVPLLFTGLLLASPGWLAFCVKGKTYAFAGVCTLVATIALLSLRDARSRWAIFTLAAAAGVATRLPTLPFFAVGWAFLFFENQGWRDRIVGTAAAVFFVGLCVFLAAAGNWESFRFWTLDFHLASGFERPFAKRVGDAIALAPAIWLSLFVSTAAGCGRGDHNKTLAACFAVLICLAVSILPVSGYGEYATPLVPSVAFLASRHLAPLINSQKPMLATYICILALAAGWLKPPTLDKDILLTAAEVENFLRTKLPPTYTVVASMPEIPAATGHPVPLSLAPGKFSVTEDFEELRAATLHLATPRSVQKMINDPMTGALVFSTRGRWNFSWSVPHFNWITEGGKNLILGDITESYDMSFESPEYVIFLRKGISNAE